MLLTLLTLIFWEAYYSTTCKLLTLLSIKKLKNYNHLAFWWPDSFKCLNNLVFDWKTSLQTLHLNFSVSFYFSFSFFFNFFNFALFNSFFSGTTSSFYFIIVVSSYSSLDASYYKNFEPPFFSYSSNYSSLFICWGSYFFLVSYYFLSY